MSYIKLLFYLKVFFFCFTFSFPISCNDFAFWSLARTEDKTQNFFHHQCDYDIFCWKILFIYDLGLNPKLPSWMFLDGVFMVVPITYFASVMERCRGENYGVVTENDDFSIAAWKEPSKGTRRPIPIPPTPVLSPRPMFRQLTNTFCHTLTFNRSPKLYGVTFRVLLQYYQQEAAKLHAQIGNMQNSNRFFKC